MSTSVTTCVTGSPVASPMRSIRSRRSQPEDVAGKVEMMISSGRHSATASIVAVYGSGSPTSPTALMPALAQELAREVDPDLGGVVDGVVVDHVAVARAVARHADDDAVVRGRPSRWIVSSSLAPPSVSLATTRIVLMRGSS